MGKGILFGFALLVVMTGCTKEPIANYDVSGATVVSGETVEFTNTSMNATTYAWDFGDGSSSNAENPTHIWAAGGTYPVSLTAFSKNEKKSDVFVSDITIGMGPVEIATAKLVKSWSMDSLTLTKPGGPNYTFLVGDLWGGTTEYLYVFTLPNTAKTYRDGVEESSGVWELPNPDEIIFDNMQTAPIITLTEGEFVFSLPSDNDPEYTETLYFTAL